MCIYIYNYVYIYVLEKAMAPHSSTLAWKIPRTEEPGGLQSMGLLGSLNLAIMNDHQQKQAHNG